MFTTQRTLRAGLLVLLALGSVIQADDLQLLPRSGVLVLRNNRVLRGSILREGDHYVLGLGNQDEVTVPVDSVKMHCDTLGEAYRQMRGQLPINAKAVDLLKLADWCLQYELFDSAAEQLMAAQRCDPQNPANEQFEKRLRLAARRPNAVPSRTAVTSPVVSQAELDQLVQSFPAGAVEQFTDTIQPLLINRCGASSCHGPNSASDFQLVYPSWSRRLPRRFTQRNLHEVRDLLDADQPGRSPLLMMATLAHGGANAPALADEDISQLQRLAGWVFGCLKSTEAARPAVVKKPDALLLQPIDRHSRAFSGAAAASLLPGGGTSADPPPLLDAAVQPVSHEEDCTKPQGATYRGVDPFDPEIFNRRYAGNSR